MYYEGIENKTMAWKAQKIGPIVMSSLALALTLTLLLIHSSYNMKSLSSKCGGNSPEPPLKTAVKVAVMVEEDQDTNFECDLSAGEWVWNENAPYYTNETCTIIQPYQNCMKFERPDSRFMKWKWKPFGCELDVFDPVRFLEIVRGKSLAFIGDSVARNHMQSLICLLSRVEIPQDIPNTTDPNSKKWRYEVNNFTISMFWSPYLVKSQRSDPNDTSSPFNIYLDEYDKTWTDEIESFDYVVISAGTWFTTPTNFYLKNRIIGCLYCSNPNITQTSNYFSYQMAFRTAFKAINNLEKYKGLTLLRTFAPSHYENGPWNKGGDCVRTLPFQREKVVWENRVVEMYKAQLKEFGAAERIGRNRGLKYRIMDLTGAMMLRPDGHPSKYGFWPNQKKKINDCVHWCLPGPIDTWNDFLLQIFMWEQNINNE